MPHKDQTRQKGAGQYQSRKRRIASEKNTETMKAILRGCESEAELREWLGAMNAVDSSAEAKRYCAALIMQVNDD